MTYTIFNFLVTDLKSKDVSTHDTILRRTKEIIFYVNEYGTFCTYSIQSTLCHLSLMTWYSNTKVLHFSTFANKRFKMSNTEYAFQCTKNKFCGKRNCLVMNRIKIFKVILEM